MASPQIPHGDVGTEVVLENDQVKVWNLDLEPGQASDWHHHHHWYVTIVTVPGTLKAEFADGTRPYRYLSGGGCPLPGQRLDPPGNQRGPIPLHQRYRRAEEQRVAILIPEWDPPASSARRADQVLRGSGRLGEGDPAGQRDHQHAPGEEGEGGQGGRQHSRPKHHRQARQGRTQNRRSAPGTGARRPGGTPPFDTDRSEGPLHDDGPS